MTWTVDYVRVFRDNYPHIIIAFTIRFTLAKLHATLPQLRPLYFTFEMFSVPFA